MPFRNTLSEARDSELQDIAGTCSSSARFLSLVNQGQQELARRGNWFGTEWIARFCFPDRCLTWPRWVGTILGAKWCRSGWSPVENSWSSIIRRASCSDHGAWPVGVRDGNTAPTLTPVQNQLGSKIRYHIVKNADVGKTIRLHGTFIGGQPLQEQVDGIWRDGLTLTAAKPFAQTGDKLIRHITSIVRQATEGPAYLYELYDDTAGLLRMLNSFEPKETNPRYRTSLIDAHTGGCKDDYGRCITSIEAMVKLQYVPVADDRDFMFLDREVWRALKLAIQAIRFEDANDFGNANGMWQQAVQCLNLEDRNKSPLNQIVFAADSAASGICNMT